MVLTRRGSRPLLLRHLTLLSRRLGSRITAAAAVFGAGVSGTEILGDLVGADVIAFFVRGLVGGCSRHEAFSLKPIETGRGRQAGFLDGFEFGGSTTCTARGRFHAQHRLFGIAGRLIPDGDARDGGRGGALDDDGGRGLGVGLLLDLIADGAGARSRARAAAVCARWRW